LWATGARTQKVYLPAGAAWRDAWHPEKSYRGGQTIDVRADVHQIPLFVRVGATLPIGDLNREWQESVEIARHKPDLRALEAAQSWAPRR
jgi:alpha-glucosidase (family GH31 glycosyl hydrolase)